MTHFDDVLARFDYPFPPELIATAPASPRDAARLLVHDRQSGKTTDAVFQDIGKFLPRDAVLVLNETKVIPARLMLSRATGGKVSILSLGARDGQILVMANRRLKAGESLTLPDGMSFTVITDEGKHWLLRPSFAVSELQNVFEKHGVMPLPPYIKQTPLTPEEQRREYQTVFAKHPGSIAAPTASLHFTEELLTKLAHSGIGIERLTLHVHLGTFAPLMEDQWTSGQLHREEYVIPASAASALMEAKKKGRPLIAVGTTVVRTLESAADESGAITRLSGETDLFIREGYRFRVVDGLITNFHVPRSSLLMLVSAFTGGEKVMELYRHAIAERYRLFSFGDAMLLL